MVKKTSLRKYSIPFFILNGLFVIIPIFIILVYAFTKKDGDNLVFTFSNFKAFFSEPKMVRSMGKSVLVALASAVVCLILAYPLALALTNPKLKIPQVLVLLFVIPMWINSLLRVLALKMTLYMFGIYEGYLSIVLGLVYDFFPFMFLPIYTILSKIDKSYLEASSDLGASSISTLIKIKLPLSVPGIISGMLMVFTPAISSYAVHEMMGGKQSSMFGSQINELFNSANENWHQGAARALIMLGIVLVSMVLATVLSRGKNKSGGRML